MTDNEPRNELEAQILEAREGHITSDNLLKTLMGSQVFMPVQDEKAPVLNIQRSSRAQPLVLSSEEEGTPILVLFSSPERAKPFIKDYPGFTGGILESFKWVLQNMGSGYGIALNPNTEVGFDMEPETVQELIEQLSTGEIRH
ncbi:MAG TPA: SseB family protein [Sulfuricaulis sp.]